ncbi:PQQ-binding-like beta-propeller repeat protein [Nocardia sp. NPDC127579]|uniref:outer membrane protein assembly factor BamB family protein n=1 Tax=Nocardia sp. NPDC127579 TaxID=3345402 RepID=UPI00363F38B4
MSRTPGLRGLVLAAVLAAVTVAGAVAVLIRPAEPMRKITGTNDAAPGSAWQVDAADLVDASGAEFRTPRYGTEFDMGGPGFLVAEDTVVTVAGSADADSMSLRDAVMIGLDADSGETRWRAPAASLGGCAAAPLDGELVCFSNATPGPSELIGYDLGSGAISRTPVDWYVFALAVTDGRLFVAEGDVESDDVRVHSGTRADPDGHWTRRFEMGTAWEELPFDALDVGHGQGVLSLGADVAGFDLRTGATTWTIRLDGCARVVLTEPALTERIRANCPSATDDGADVFDRAGRMIATTGNRAVHDLTLDQPADDSIPILLADTAYDRRDGAVRWTNPDLLAAEPFDPGAVRGAADAVLGDIAILRDRATDTTMGLDLNTGRTRWRMTTDRDGDVQARDGDHAIFTDASGLWAVDLYTGETRWEIPYLAIDSDRAAFSGSVMLSATGSGRLIVATARTLLSLRPLP